MLNLFKYYYHKKRYPEFLDFIDMGLGIEARYHRCKKYWRKHLELTREFQTQVLQLSPKLESLAILGAGRLLDVDLPSVQERFKVTTLYDADPTGLALWRKCPIENLRYHLLDITGCLSIWTKKLNDFLVSEKIHDLKRLSEFIGSLELKSSPIKDKYSCVYSINLLSQIPIYWRNRVQNCLKKYWKMETDPRGRYDHTLQTTLESSMGLLQNGHLALLSELRPEVIILTTDHWFHYYKKNVSKWQSEKALYLDQDISLDGYQLSKKRSWLWHIAPQGIEQKDYGIIHEVHAYGFVR